MTEAEQPKTINQAAQNLAAKMGGSTPQNNSKETVTPEKPTKPRKDYGFKGYWDDALYGCAFRVCCLAIALSLLRFVAPVQAVQWLGWGSAVGLWLFLRIRDCQKPFGLTNWAIAIFIATNIHDLFWSVSKP